MTTGDKTWKGLGVPLNGEFELRQITAATDHVTLTAASGASGDFFVCRTAGAGELFVIGAEGQLTVASAVGLSKLVTIASGGMTLTDGTLTITKGSTVLTAGGVTLTDGALTISAGDIAHTSGDYLMTKGDLQLIAGDVILNKDKFIKFSVPIATAPATVVKGEMFLIIKSETPQLGIAWAGNSIKYITADTATMGRATA